MTAANPYFGLAWNPRIAAGARAPTPIGVRCWHCAEPIEDGDQGIIMPCCGAARPIHLDCLLRLTLGSLGHQRRRCSCYGGDEEDPPGLTVREAARAAVAYHETGALPCCPECGHVDGHDADCDELVDTVVVEDAD